MAPAPAVAADPTVRRDPDEREEPEDFPGNRDDTVASGDEVRARPSLLGRLTEPLGVSCGGLLRAVCGRTG